MDSADQDIKMVTGMRYMLLCLKRQGYYVKLNFPILEDALRAYNSAKSDDTNMEICLMAILKEVQQ